MVATMRGDEEKTTKTQEKCGSTMLIDPLLARHATASAADRKPR